MKKTLAENKEELAAALAGMVMAHAESRYQKGGWDVIVECWTREEIAKAILVDGLMTKRSAIKMFSSLASVFAERQADAAYHRRQAGEVF